MNHYMTHCSLDIIPFHKYKKRKSKTTEELAGKTLRISIEMQFLFRCDFLDQYYM